MELLVWILIGILCVAVITLLATTESLRESVNFLRSEVHNIEVRLNNLTDAMKLHEKEKHHES